MICIGANLHTYQPIYVPTYFPTYLPTHLSYHLDVRVAVCVWIVGSDNVAIDPELLCMEASIETKKFNRCKKVNIYTYIYKYVSKPKCSNTTIRYLVVSTQRYVDV